MTKHEQQIRDDLQRRARAIAGDAGQLVALVFDVMAPDDRQRFEQMLACGAAAAVTVRFIGDERPRAEVRLGLVDDRDETAETLLAVNVAILQTGGAALQ